MKNQQVSVTYDEQHIEGRRIVPQGGNNVLLGLNCYAN